MSSDDSNDTSVKPQTTLQDGAPQPSAVQSTPPKDRSELLNKARAFLTSPQVRHDDPDTTKRFLVEKGLNEAEIHQVMNDTVSLLPMLCSQKILSTSPKSLDNRHSYLHERILNPHLRIYHYCSLDLREY